MKIDNSGYAAKAVLLVISGALIAFFPQIVNWIFYILGGMIVVSCLFILLTSMGSGDGGLMSSSSLFGIAAGVGVMFLPKLLGIGIAIAGGIVFMIMGIVRLIKALSSSNNKDNRLLSGIVGGVLVAVSILLLINPFSAASAARVTIGIVMIVYGLFNGYVAYEINKRNKFSSGSSPDVIDINDFTVHDDK